MLDEVLLRLHRLEARIAELEARLGVAPKAPSEVPPMLAPTGLSMRSGAC